MIPYDELAAALERWRTRNGLAVVTPPFSPQPRSSTAGHPPPVAAYAAPATATLAAAVPPPPAPMSAPRTAPPNAPPPGRSTIYGVPPMPLQPPPTVDESVDEMIDAEEVEDSNDQYAREVAAPRPMHATAPAPLDEDDERESTMLGPTPPPPSGPPPSPPWSEAPRWPPDSPAPPAGHEWGPTGDDDPADDDLS